MILYLCRQRMTKVPFVQVRATFVDVKVGYKASIFIEEPLDLMPYIGDLYADEYERLKEGINMIVNDPAYNFYIHNNDSYEFF